MSTVSNVRAFIYKLSSISNLLSFQFLFDSCTAKHFPRCIQSIWIHNKSSHVKRIFAIWIKMWNKSRKRFISLVILSLLNMPLSNYANPIAIKPSILTEPMLTMIEYITKLFCSNQFTYRFNHIYVEQSVKTVLADKLINQIHLCVCAGVLVSRYHNFIFTFRFSHNYKVIWKGLHFTTFLFSSTW